MSATAPARRDALILFATVGFALSVRSGAASVLFVLVGSIFLFLFAFTGERKNPGFLPSQSDTWSLRILILVVLFGGLSAIGWVPSSIGPSSMILERIPGVFWAGLALVTFVTRRKASAPFQAGLVGVAVIATVVFGIAHLRAAEGVGIDVYFLHTEAADAIASGLNPYTDAVEVRNGAPTAEPGDTIEGYLYPPATAVAYSLGYWAFSDPRATSLIGWAALLAVLGSMALRSRSTPGLLAMLLMAALPGWPLVLRAAWTEPFTLALIALAYVGWKKPICSGSTAGLALASKQYFFVVAPVLFLYRDNRWITRLLTMAGMIGVTIGAGLLWDPQAFWSANIEFHLSTPPRADSANLVGLASILGFEWDPPGFLAIAVGITLAVLAGRGSTTRQSFLLALTLALTGSFLVGSQALPNYWFLVAGLCGLVLTDALTTSADVSPDSGSDHRQEAVSGSESDNT